MADAGAKVIKVVMAEGKVITRLPSTGAKVIKVITYMEMGDTLDRYDSFDTLARGGRMAGVARRTAGGSRRQ